MSSAFDSHLLRLLEPSVRAFLDGVQMEYAETASRGCRAARHAASGAADPGGERASTSIDEPGVAYTPRPATAAAPAVAFDGAVASGGRAVWLPSRKALISLESCAA
jgi:hypothetical protein